MPPHKIHMIVNFLSSISSSLWTKEVIFSFFAALGGGILLWGLLLEFRSEKQSEIQSEENWFSDLNKYRSRYRKSLCGEKWVIVGVSIEIIVAVVFAVIDVKEKYDIGKKIDPANFPVFNINALVKLRVKGNVFPDLTQWDSIPISTNWGSKKATATLCGNGPNSVLQSLPTMISDDFGIGTGYPDSREYFLNLHMESVSAAMNLSAQPASKSFSVANFIAIDVRFLPPQSEILDGYAFVVVNNSLGKLFRIYPQKNMQLPFPNKEQAAMLPPIHPVMQFIVSGQTDAVAGTKLSLREPGKVTSLTNGEIFPTGGGFFWAECTIVGTNVPSEKFEPNW